MADELYAKQLRNAVKETLRPYGYKVAGRRSFVRELGVLECAVKLQGSRYGGEPYRVSWGVVVPALVEPLWLMKYVPGEPSAGCLFAVHVNLPGAAQSTQLRDEDSDDLERSIARMRDQAKFAAQQMAGISSLEDLGNEIERDGAKDYWFPFEPWPRVIVAAVAILQNPSSYDEVVRSLGWNDLSVRARTVLEAVLRSK